MSLKPWLRAWRRSQAFGESSLSPRNISVERPLPQKKRTYFAVYILCQRKAFLLLISLTFGIASIVVLRARLSASPPARLSFFSLTPFSSVCFIYILSLLFCFVVLCYRFGGCHQARRVAVKIQGCAVSVGGCWHRSVVAKTCTKAYMVPLVGKHRTGAPKQRNHVRACLPGGSVASRIRHCH